MTSKTKKISTPELAEDHFHSKYQDLETWLDAILIYSEELGRERKYFDWHSSYAETYHRRLTPRQATMRQAYKQPAAQEHEEEIEDGAQWSEAADFNL